MSSNIFCLQEINNYFMSLFSRALSFRFFYSVMCASKCLTKDLISLEQHHCENSQHLWRKRLKSERLFQGNSNERIKGSEQGKRE